MKYYNDAPTTYSESSEKYNLFSSVQYINASILDAGLFWKKKDIFCAFYLKSNMTSEAF